MTEPSQKLLKQVVIGGILAAALGIPLKIYGWHGPTLLSRSFNYFDYDLEWNRLTPALILWVVFFGYWTIVSTNSSKSKSSESKTSTVFHQMVLNMALLLLFIPVPGMDGWFLPPRFHFVVAVGAIIQAGFAALGFWARGHLGKNWSAEVRIGEGHQLVRTGPYRMVRHPIYNCDARDVSGDDDSFKSVSLAARTGIACRCVRAENASGREYTAKDVWGRMGRLP
jgi:hypothetical protein